MRHDLKLHRDFECKAVTGIAVEATRPRPGALALRYVVSGAIRELRLPPPAAPVRTDELWRHTCFEAFVKPAFGQGYCELNFAPSTQWAAYRFDDYRAGMQALETMPMPSLSVRVEETRLEIAVALDRLPDGAAAWHIGLSAVIEETSGRKSYWALTHPPGRADFHHADCFGLELAAASLA